MIERVRCSQDRNREAGVSLAIAILLVLTIGVIGASYSDLSISNFEMTKYEEATLDVNLAAEAAVHNTLGAISLAPHLWLEKTRIVSPAGYSSYNPASYTSNNGIPTCSGMNCHRDMYPQSGGLLKNFGPIGGDGESVDAAKTITQQLNLSSLPTAEVTLGDAQAWSQLEKLDEIFADTTTIGGTFDGFESPTATRYRVTGTAIRNVKGLTARSTIVTVIQVPSY